MNFEYYLRTGKVKRTTPNISRAKSLIEIAKKRFEYAMKRKDDSEILFIFEDLYECIKEVIQAFMEKEGFHPYSHEAIVAFAEEYLGLSKVEIIKLDQMRRIRNDILYRGEIKDVRKIYRFLNHAV